MKTSHRRHRRQRGIAALELALVMPVLLTLPLYFGRLFWYYAALQKGAQNAVRYPARRNLRC